MANEESYRWFRDRRVILALLLLTILPYLWSRLDCGWIAHDEGLLGQSAERVLHGELPHVDFDDAYTGGQAMLHAAAFKLFGVRSVSLRYVLFAFSCCFVVAHYRIATHFAPAWSAGLVTWLSVAWSVPNYFAGLPSWYNLFFAVLGCLALVRYDESQRKHWLVVAGIFGGLSFLIKLSGLFYVAAGLLFLVYREQETLVDEPDDEAISKRRRIEFKGFVFMCIGLFAVLLLLMIRQRLTIMDTVVFVVPGVSLSLYLLGNERRCVAMSSWPRFKRLLFPIAWFLLGVTAPVGLFLVPYLLHDGLGAFIQGVFVLPQKRMKWAGYPLPPLSSLVTTMPLLLLLAMPLVTKRNLSSALVTCIAAMFAVIGIALGSEQTLYQSVWHTTRPLVPMLALIGCVILWRLKAGDFGFRQRRELFLLLAMGAMTSLVQFPYSFGIYFCYAAPFAILGWLALVAAQENAPKGLHLCVLFFYLGFALVWLNQGRIQRIGVQFIATQYDTPLELERSGLRVSASDAELYQAVIVEIAAHSEPDDYIYAAVDCPEIYFLSGRKNPTRTFYDFFEPDFESAPAARFENLLPLLDSRHVEVVVLHWQGEFSGPLPIEFAGALAQRYPNVKHFTRGSGDDGSPVFSVAWRDDL